MCLKLQCKARGGKSWYSALLQQKRSRAPHTTRGKIIRNERKRVPRFPDIWLCQKLFGRRGNTPLLQRIKNRWTELREEEDKDRSSWHARVRLVTWTILAFHSRYHTLGVIRFTAHTRDWKTNRHSRSENGNEGQGNTQAARRHTHAHWHTSPSIRKEPFSDQ